jgi:aspartyl aminopeptidase
MILRPLFRSFHSSIRRRTMAGPHLEFANDFIDFLNEAITPFHAVEASKKRLKAAGFVQVSERDEWKLQRGGKYFFARNDTSIVAFSVGSQFPQSGGSFTVLAAHTDSPCLRIKPVACFQKGQALMLNTQPYGGGKYFSILLFFRVENFYSISLFVCFLRSLAHLV